MHTRNIQYQLTVTVRRSGDNNVDLCIRVLIEIEHRPHRTSTALKSVRSFLDILFALLLKEWQFVVVVDVNVDR